VAPAGEEEVVALSDLKELSAAELDALLLAISLERVKRDPPVSMEQPQTVEAAVDPKWFASMTGANTFMQFRHPGYGWVGYMIPPASRATLAAVLLQHSLMPVSRPDAAPPVVMTGGGTLH
jgi:hypothetical protein